MVYESVIDLIGGTPLVRLHKVEEEIGTSCILLAKLEKNNPSGSSKDRAVKQMLLDMLKEGKIKKGSTIVEPTSGNTGIALASLSNYFGLRAIIVMPSSMSEQRKQLIQAYGAKLVLVDGNMSLAIAKAEEIRKSIPGAVSLSQFDNLSNEKVHFLSTGPELYHDENELDYILAGIGSGGTVSGIGHFYKSKGLSTKIIGLEPFSSPYLTKGISGKHEIEGIGAGFRPKNYIESYVDEVRTVKDEEAFFWAKKIVSLEGLLVGVSSGAALAGAVDLIKEKKLSDKKIAMIFPDTGERYSWN